MDKESMYHEFPILLNIGGKLYDHILIAVEPYLLGNGKHHHKHDILELSEIREFTCLSYTMRFVQFSLGIRVGETVDHHCFNLFHFYNENDSKILSIFHANKFY